MVDFNSLINAMINGVFVGMGATLGTYLITHHFIKHLEKLENSIIKEPLEIPKKKAHKGVQSKKKVKL